MYNVELFFKRQGRTLPEERAAGAIDELVRALQRNGQILEGITIPTAIVRGGYQTVASIPERRSLSLSLHSTRVRTAMRDLKRSGLALPRARVIGRQLDSTPVCGCRRSASLILTTNFLTSELPLRCGGCHGVVPFYRFPHTTDYGTYEDIISWTWHYRAFDGIWIASGAGERLAYRELSEHDSKLSRWGHDLCRLIDKRSGAPTYYYLMKHYGRSVASERKRKCPDCGGKWLLKEPWHRLYDFKCDRCRLLSNIAFDVEVKWRSDFQHSRA
jgi:predicted  nucleic acid-binding Zn ribbon protein